jgi:hypothetical protein
MLPTWGQILTPRSASACLLPPNADIAMFAGRARPEEESKRDPARRCPPRRVKPMKSPDRGLSAVLSYHRTPADWSGAPAERRWNRGRCAPIVPPLVLDVAMRNPVEAIEAP